MTARREEEREYERRHAEWLRLMMTTEEANRQRAALETFRTRR